MTLAQQSVERKAMYPYAFGVFFSCAPLHHMNVLIASITISPMLPSQMLYRQWSFLISITVERRLKIVFVDLCLTYSYIQHSEQGNPRAESCRLGSASPGGLRFFSSFNHRQTDLLDVLEISKSVASCHCVSPPPLQNRAI